MKMKWAVTGKALDRATGKNIGAMRTEAVDNTNPIFADCKTILEVKSAYESFWNDLNDSSKAVVSVSRVVPVE